MRGSRRFYEVRASSASSPDFVTTPKPTYPARGRELLMTTVYGGAPREPLVSVLGCGGTDFGRRSRSTAEFSADPLLCLLQDRLSWREG